MASRAQRGQTGARPMTSMMGAGSLENRPLTKLGVSTGGGPGLVSQSGGRMIQDSSFWLTELARRQTELSTEANKLLQDIDRSSKDVKNIEQYRVKLEEKQRELKQVLHSIGEYNMMIERTGTDPSLLEAEYRTLNAKSMALRRTADEVAGYKRQVQDALKQVESQTTSEAQAVDSLLASMPQHLRLTYDQAAMQKKQLEAEVSTVNEQISHIDSEIAKAFLSIANDPEKIRAYEMQKSIVALKYNLQILELEEQRLEESSSLTPAQLQDSLLRQIKNDNQEIANMETKISDIELEINKLMDLNNQKPATVSESAGELNEQEFAALEDSYAQAQNYLNSFEQQKETLSNECSSLEQRIQNLTLEFNEMSSHVNLLTSADSSASSSGNILDTVKVLMKEKSQKQQELEKVAQSESKIDDEISEMRDRLAQLNTDILKYSNIEQVKASAIDKKKTMQLDKQHLQKAIQDLKKNVIANEQRYESMRKKLNNSEMYIQLNSLQQRLKSLEANNYSIQSSSNQMSADSNMEVPVMKLTAVSSEYNNLIQESLAGYSKGR